LKVWRLFNPGVDRIRQAIQSPVNPERWAECRAVVVMFYVIAADPGS